MSTTRPAFHIITWGCQMNDDDSLQMTNLLLQMGYRQTSEPSEADVILLNTCSVRDKPEHKVSSKLGELRELKLANRDLVIGVCGCMAQRAGEEITRTAPCVDMVIGTDGIFEIPELIGRVRAGERPVYALGLPERNGHPIPAKPRRVTGEVGIKRFVPIMYGCDNFCAYCVVPVARGPERSRPMEDVIAEVEELVSLGCREVTLLGQNVNSYRPEGERENGGMGEWATRTSNVEHRTPNVEHRAPNTEHPITEFADLLERLNDIEGLWRIRFVTSHPKDLSERLIEAMSLPKVCEHLHLPIQAGDDDILRAMNRGYTVERYMSLVENLRGAIPRMAITTDVMVGFPGETEEQFRNTLCTLEEIRFDAAFMFAFNVRPGTEAAEMPGQVDHKTKLRRLLEVIDLQNGITLERNQDNVGRTFEVLVERTSEKDSSRLTGYTRRHKTVVFRGSPDLIGRLVTVMAVKAHPWGFSGEMME